jgi:cell division septum initiation protein DivIVA
MINKVTAIHIAVEVVLVTCALLMIVKKNRQLQEEVDDLQQRVDELDQTVQDLRALCERAIASPSTQLRPRAAPPSPRPQLPPKSAPAPVTAPAPRPRKQQQQQPPVPEAGPDKTARNSAAAAMQSANEMFMQFPLQMATMFAAPSRTRVTPTPTRIEEVVENDSSSELDDELADALRDEEEAED